MSYRPKVVHAFNVLGVGGSETLALEVIRHFSKSADNAVLVLDSKEQSMRNAFEALNLPITTLDHLPGKHWQLIHKSYDYFKKHKPDALLCWSFGNHAFVGLGARLAGVSNVVTSVQTAPPINSPLMRRFRILARLGSVSSKYLVACSEYVRDLLIKDVHLVASHVVAINNGCNVEEIRRRAAEGVKTKPNKTIIGMVARLDKAKDHKTLIRALPAVLKEYSSAELWLVGDGDEREALEKLTSTLRLNFHVKFLGNRFDVPELLSHMDLFVFSATEIEGFGIVLTEALAAGIPIVASDVGSCREVLKNGEWGLLVEPSNPEKLGQAIIQSLSGTRPLPRYGDVFQSFDTSITAKKYWNLLFNC